MKNTLETRLGLFFALALIVAYILIEVLGGIPWLRRGYDVHARFETVQELSVGDSVKMAGVPIGRVAAIELTNNRVQITMTIDENRIVRTDSKASIRFAGLLGQNFVDVDFGSPQGVPVEPGAFLQTVHQPDLNSLMTRLDNVASGVENLTKSFTGDTINNLLGPLTDFLEQNAPTLTDFFDNMRTVSDRFVQGEGTIGRLIADDTLYTTALNTVTNMQESFDEIRLTVAEARNVVTQINEGEGTLGRLATDEALYTETTTAMTNLREILEKINRGEGSVGKLINEETFYDNAKLTLQKVEKATEGLEDQGPLSVLGIAVNSLF
jgi:phospholipid/cholesterol/gamma-HCH transport system substrate-binding protein